MNFILGIHDELFMKQVNGTRNTEQSVKSARNSRWNSFQTLLDSSSLHCCLFAYSSLFPLHGSLSFGRQLPYTFFPLWGCCPLVLLAIGHFHTTLVDKIFTLINCMRWQFFIILKITRWQSSHARFTVLCMGYPNQMSVEGCILNYFMLSSLPSFFKIYSFCYPYISSRFVISVFGGTQSPPIHDLPAVTGCLDMSARWSPI